MNTMEMNTQLNFFDPYLNLAIEEYKAIQEKHIRAFDTELMPDIELQNFERKRAFSEMKNRFDIFLSKTLTAASNKALNNCSDIVPDVPDYVDIVELYITKIQNILDSDALLKEKIFMYKKQLKKHLDKTKKFKTAFNGYSASNTTKNIFQLV